MAKHLRWIVGWMQLWAYAIGMGCMLCVGLTAILDPLLIKWIIDVGLPRREPLAVIVAAVGVCVIYVGRSALNWLAGWTTFRANQNMVLKMQFALIERLQAFSAEWFDSTPGGDTLFRVQQDVQQIGELSSALLTAVVRSIILALITLGAMLMLNVRLALLVLLLAPVFVQLCRRNRRTLNELSELAQKAAAQAACRIQECVLNALHIQVLRCGTSQCRRYLTAAHVARDAERRRYANELLYTFSYFSIIAVGVGLVLGYGGILVIRGALTVGGLVAFYSYLVRFLDPLSGVADIDARLLRLSVSAGRIRELAEAVPTVRDHPHAIAIDAEVPGSIVFHDVWFAYQSGCHVLRGTELEIRAGEIVALTGSTGCGKTTVLKLLSRLYDVSGGSIQIGSNDIRNVSLRSLRSVAALINQDTVLFDGSLRDNLLLVRPSATQRDLDAAAQIVCLEDVLARLPRGWDQPLGGLTMRLSGGERQRVALARAILRDARILLLDESTSALDGAMEAQVLEGLRHAFAERTVIIVSHRPSAIEWADRVLVMENGRISSDGGISAPVLQVAQQSSPSISMLS